MTAPISFPTISPPQVVQRRSQLDDLPQLILALAQHRESVANAHAQLELERQRTEDQLANSTENRAASKEERARAQAEHEHKLKVYQAHDIVANALPGVLTAPGDFTQNAEAARVKLIQQNKQLAPFINDAFNSQLGDIARTRTAIAERRKAEAEAPVAEKTAGARIKAAQNAADQSDVDLATSRLTNTLKSLEVQGFDAQKLAVANDFARTSGLPWGIVRKQFGLPSIKGGLEDTFTFPEAKTAASGQLEQAANQLRLANDGINALGNKGLSVASYASLSAGAWTSGAINALSSRDQQELAAAYSQFIAPIQAVLVKGAASDKDVQRMQRAYVTLDSDDRTVRAQKALVRTALAESFNPAATDYVGMLDKFEAIIKTHGIPRNSPVVAPFLAMRPKLREAQKRADTAAEHGDDPMVSKLLTPATSMRPPQR